MGSGCTSIVRQGIFKTTSRILDWSNGSLLILRRFVLGDEPICRTDDDKTSEAGIFPVVWRYIASYFWVPEDQNECISIVYSKKHSVHRVFY